jgi:hypothetical protein
LERVGLTCKPETRRKITFKGDIDGQLITGSLEARTRTKYAGDIRYRSVSGYRLLVEVPALTDGRLVLTHQAYASKLTRWLNRKGNLVSVSLPAALPTHEAWGADVNWATTLLADASLLDHLAILVPHRSASKQHSVQWYPDRIGYSSFGGIRAHATTIGDAMTRLAAVANLSLSHPVATVKHRPGWMEKHPIRVVLFLFGAVLAIAVLFTALMIGLAILISKT